MTSAIDPTKFHSGDCDIADLTTFATTAKNEITTLQGQTALIPSPALGTALYMIRINSGGTSYEARSPSQVLADIAALPLTGGTLTGLLTINPASGAGLAITGPVSNSRFQQFQTSGTARWSLGLATGESGVGNAGSDYFVQRHDDAGAAIDRPITIARTSGVANFATTPTVAGTALLTTTVAAATYVAKAGDTMTGSLTIAPASGDAVAALDAVAGQSRILRLKRGGGTRWDVTANTTSESGANAGTNLQITRYDDSAVSLGNAVTITRSTGVTDFSTTPTVGGTALLTTTAAAAAYQPLDADLTGLAAVNAAAGDAGRALVATGANAYALAGPFAGLTNRVINGDMRIVQRATSAAGVTTNSTGTPAGYATIDRFYFLASGTPATVTLSQVFDSPTLGANGFCQKVLVTTNKASVAAGDFAWLQHRFEGYNVADLLALGSTVTIDFWCKSPKTGTHYVAFLTSTGGASYVASYSVSSANTWERKTVQVSLAGALATGTGWDLTTGIGLALVWPLVAGTTYRTGTLTTWQASNVVAGNSQQNLFDTNSNVFQLGDVQLYAGSTTLVFERRPYHFELALCMRYYQTLIPCILGNNTAGAAAIGSGFSYVFPVPMRATPTVSAPSGGTPTNVTTSAFDNISPSQVRFAITSVTANGAYAYTAAFGTAYAEI